MKQLCYYLIFIIIVSSFTNSERNNIRMATNVSLGNKLNRKDKESEALMGSFLEKSTSSNKSQTLNNEPALWKGWVKFFHYESSGQEMAKPTSFFINNEFFRQAITLDDRKLKDKIGYRHIPSRFHFFGILLNNNFNILSSRYSDIARNVDSFQIGLIVPLDKSKIEHSTIRDLGKFSEGQCISLDTKRPSNPDINFEAKEGDADGISEKWVICLDNDKEKKNLFQTLIKLKLAFQKKQEAIQEKKNETGNESSLAEVLNKQSNVKMEKGTHENDGYLILLQDWSQCTLKCGGGVEVQQWMCIPPKQGGQPCKGQLIRKRPCNTQRCPGSTVDNSSNSKQVVKNINVTLKPIMKILPFSRRPQQYIKCKINEADVLVEQKNDTGVVLLPARLLLNTRTISLFNNEEYNTSIFTFKLKNTIMSASKSNHCCFYLNSENNKFKICAFGSDCGTNENPAFVRFWQETFGLFRDKCFENMTEENAANSIGAGPNASKKDDVLGAMNLSMDEANERMNKIEEKIEDKQESSLNNQIGNTQVAALRVIKKEIGIEELIKSEMNLKSRRETDELLQLLKHEEKKKEQLEKIFQEKDTEDVQVRERREASNQMKAIEVEAKKEVEAKREALKNKIMEIKQKTNRRKKIIEQKINLIRTEMANKLIKANKSGDMLTCKNALADTEKIKIYCNNNISDDFEKNADCKSPSSFCYICCENEFGNMLIQKRDACYDMCDKLVGEQLDSGEFVWQKQS